MVRVETKDRGWDPNTIQHLPLGAQLFKKGLPLMLKLHVKSWDVPGTSNYTSLLGNMT